MTALLSWAALLSFAIVAKAVPSSSSPMTVNQIRNMRQFRSLGAAMHHRHIGRNLNSAFIHRPSSGQSLDLGSSFSSNPMAKIQPTTDPKFHGRFYQSLSWANLPMSKNRLLTSQLRSSLSTMDETDLMNKNDEQQSGPSFTDELNPSQTEATLRPRYSITRVVAGPGAGKTRVLTCRIAHLLLDKTNVSNDTPGYREDREGILAVTFTKKAAMEMERRLTDLVASETRISSSDASPSISTDDDGMEEGEFVAYGNADPYDENDTPNEMASKLMRRTTVGTFHSVCSKILRKFGSELGDLPSVRNCVGMQNAAGATVFQEGVQTESSEEDDQSMNLVQTLDGSFNIVDQSDQLRLLNEVLKKFNIQLKSPDGSSGGKSNDIRPITVLNAISLLNTRDAAKLTSTGGNPGDMDEDIASKVSRKVLRIAEAIQVPFQKAKYSQNSVDFDDLILLTRELLLRHPEVREVLHRRWRHVLVDEFQDTSQVQLDLVRLLTTNSLFAVGDGDQSIYSWRGASPESMSDFEVAFHDRNHGWEGLLKNHDENLAQYLGRISRVREEEMSEDMNVERSLLKVKSVYLMENYRSTTNIVKAAQRIISVPDKSNKGKEASAQDNIRRDMKPMRGAGPSPRVLACKDARAEARFVVNTVNSMIDSGDLTPSSTLAMIYRTNAQSRLLEEACVERNLRYVVKGSSGTFYKRAEIQDCMSFMKIMYNDRDRSAWARAVKAPSRGIGPASLDEFFRYCDAVSDKYSQTASSRDDIPTPMDVLISLVPSNGQSSDDIATSVPPKEFLSTRSLNRFVPFALSLKALRGKAEMQAVPDFLLSVIDDLGLKGHFDTISKTRDEYEDRLSNVMELVKASERYKGDGPCILQISEDELETPLGNFLDDVALIADLSPDEESEAQDGGRIVANLMTIHSSKGMEFDAVFLVGNEEGTFPTQRAIAEGESSIELSEERRLCYVAMTRAKTHLVLTWRREVAYFAGASFKTKDGDRSRFLDALVSKQGDTSNKGGSKPSGNIRTNNGTTRKKSFKSDQRLNSMTKRQLHSEADRYLASGGSRSWDKPEPSSQKKPIERVPPIRPNSPISGVDKRQVMPSFRSQSEADRYDHLASEDGSRSWDNREPSSQKKPIERVPSIRPNSPISGVDKRQVMPSFASQSEADRYEYLASEDGSRSWDKREPSSQKKPIERVPSMRSNSPISGVDKRQIMPSSGSQNRQMQTTNRELHSKASRQLTSGGSRSWDEWEPSSQMKPIEKVPSIRPSSLVIKPSFRSAIKKPSQARRTPVLSDNKRASLQGELPPDYDSTMFYAVGSSVKHQFHGRGIVQTPPNADEKFVKKMLVRVKFVEDSMARDLPMDGLTHTYE